MAKQKTAIDKLLDGVTWVPISPPTDHPGGDVPYPTHTGILQIGESQMHCYRLSDGQRVFERSDVFQFFGVTETEWNEVFG